MKTVVTREEIDALWNGIPESGSGGAASSETPSGRREAREGRGE